MWGRDLTTAEGSIAPWVCATKHMLHAPRVCMHLALKAVECSVLVAPVGEAGYRRLALTRGNAHDSDPSLSPLSLPTGTEVEREHQWRPAATHLRCPALARGGLVVQPTMGSNRVHTDGWVHPHLAGRLAEAKGEGPKRHTAE